MTKEVQRALAYFGAAVALYWLLVGMADMGRYEGATWSPAAHCLWHPYVAGFVVGCFISAISIDTVARRK